jgi:hypothetical protein
VQVPKALDAETMDKARHLALNLKRLTGSVTAEIWLMFSFVLYIHFEYE